MQGFDWNDLRVLLAIARQGSLAAASRQLGVNETTVGRRVTRAEARLGARLFERNHGALYPTAAGARVIAGAERIELEMQSVEGAVAGSDALVAGSVRVTAVPVLVNRVLVPAMPRLLRDHPELRLELIAEPRDLSLTKREADIALRLARPHKDVRAITRRIGRLEYGVYGPGQGPTEALPWITYEDGMADLPQRRWVAERSDESASASPALLVNDAETLIQGAIAGLGRAILPVTVADKVPGLARLDGDPSAMSREAWLMVHPELRDLARIRAVIDWLAALFAPPYLSEPYL